MILRPADGADYLHAVAGANPGARYVSDPSEVLERRPFFRRRGRTSAELGFGGEISAGASTSVTAGVCAITGRGVSAVRVRAVDVPSTLSGSLTGARRQYRLAPSSEAGDGDS
jgi:CO/xanthine dehydrogenase Mo-binding subunit